MPKLGLRKTNLHYKLDIEIFFSIFDQNFQFLENKNVFKLPNKYSYNKIRILKKIVKLISMSVYNSHIVLLRTILISSVANITPAYLWGN